MMYMKADYPTAETKLKVILSAVCEETNVPVEKILKRRGKVDVSNARNLICYLACQSDLGLKNIGKFLAGRDHATIGFNRDALKGHMQVDNDLKQLCERVTEKVA